MSKFSLPFKVMEKRIPLIVILGGTGTGKSKLGIEIAKRFNSEIISADSMQVYKGLDILTNKVTAKERAEVPHHMLDFVSPLDNFTVYNFRDKSLPIIDELFKSGKPPVIVGGTNYYIESVLWQTLVNVNQIDENDKFNGRKGDLVMKVCEKLGFKPISTGIKRKSNYLNILPISKCPKLVNTPRELYMLSNYCNKLLNSIKKILINEDYNKLNDIFNRLIEMKSINEIENTFHLLKKSIMELNQSSNKNESMFDSLMFCLKLKHHINLILGKFKDDFLENSNNLSVEEILEIIKNHKLDSSLVIIQDSVQKLQDLVATHIPHDLNILENDPDSNLSTLQLYDLIKKVDPERAACLHPNDERKILRSLEIWLLTGRKHSDMIHEQQNEGSALGGPLRFKNTIIFWLTADPEILNKRLDERVHQMLDHGLVEELLNFYSEYQPKEDDFTKGIFQSIGFKEFREFLLLSDSEKFREKGKKKLDDGIETLKLVTRRYVKYQNKWIKNRFFKYPDREVPPVYELNTSDVGRWDELVLNPAIDVITSTIEGASSKLKPLTKENCFTKEEVISLKTGEYFCEDCKRTFIGLMQWNIHISSNKHKKIVNRNKREAGYVPVFKEKNTDVVEFNENLNVFDSDKMANTSST